eukprot:s1783_g9.t1
MAARAQRAPTQEEILRAFRTCGDLDAAEARRMAPAILQVVCCVALVAEVRSACHGRGRREPFAAGDTCFRDLCCVMRCTAAYSIAHPHTRTRAQDRFVISPSIEIPNSIWAVLLHPGSVNSSGLLPVVLKALDRIMRRHHIVEIAEVKRQDEELEARGQKGDIALPPKGQCLAGGGSLAATGR